MSWHDPTLLIAVFALGVSIMAAIFSGLQAWAARAQVKEARLTREGNEKQLALQARAIDAQAQAFQSQVEALNLLVGAISRLNTN